MNKDEFIIIKNRNLLLERIITSLNTSAAPSLLTVKNRIKGNVLCVGTGGSFASAVFAAKCINECENDALALAVKPRDALLSLSKKIDIVLLFSYSGTTNDIVSVYTKCKKLNITVYAITRLDSELQSIPYDKNETISYHSENDNYEEKGFISMASTLIPVCLFANAYLFDNKLENWITPRFEKWNNYFDALPILENKTIPLTVDVFSGYDTLTSSTILESDIIESGIGRATVHEKKDFSHGRYNAIESSRPDLVVYYSNEEGAFSKKLTSYLLDRVPSRFLEIKNDYGVLKGDLDLVIATQFLVAKLSEECNYDMSDPVYPEEAKSLYKFSDKDII